MSVLVKICGLSTAETVDASIAGGADFIGLVFFPASPRHVGLEQARTLGLLTRGRIRKAALTVDANDATLADIVEALGPDLLQLHGREAPERVAAIKKRFGLPVMKALPVAAKSDLARIRDYAGVADWLLFDARAPKEATRPGGLGQPFDWGVLEGLDSPIPFMLSGGLHADNVSEAWLRVRPAGFDVSSGVERAVGVKDVEKIGAFIRAARAGAAADDLAKASMP